VSETSSSQPKIGRFVLSTLGSILKRLTFSRVIIVGAVFIIAVLWWSHNEYLRNEGRLEEVQKQSAARAKSLEAQIDEAVKKAALEHAAAMRELESRRRKLENMAGDLQKRLDDIRTQERGRLQDIAALPLDQLSAQVTQQLGGEGQDIVVSAPSSKQSAEPESSTPNPNLVVTEEGFRKIATALSQLESCQEQDKVKDQLLSNCQEQASLNASAVGKMNQTVNDLQELVRKKDEVIAQKDAAHAAELKAARGTWGSRILRAAKYIAVGVAIGVAVR
jgi:hypothetical protein